MKPLRVDVRMLMGGGWEKVALVGWIKELTRGAAKLAQRKASKRRGKL